ncbi:MAG: efflux RND transporter periplasmic adaptor subunit, partial [Candidatus Glassbacteria bacterium]|nr:efflux RND transporter periplasmic adaptor subunit [Candidatus Glassbacteria bacterium]
ITQEQYDQMLAEAEALKATVRADRAALDNAGINLDYCLIRAPLAGRTGRLLVHQGNIIKANSDSPLVVIHQVEPVYVRFTVPEQHLTGILTRFHEGALEVRAFLQDAEPKTGRVSFVDNAVDQSTGTIALKAVFANGDKLLWPGEFVNVSLVLRLIRDAVVVPTRAVQSGQEGEYVFVIRPDKTVESRPVAVGYVAGEQTVVQEGLQPGEVVVADGQLRLYPGAKVEETGEPGTEKAGGQ